MSSYGRAFPELLNHHQHDASELNNSSSHVRMWSSLLAQEESQCLLHLHLHLDVPGRTHTAHR